MACPPFRAFASGMPRTHYSGSPGRWCAEAPASGVSTWAVGGAAFERLPDEARAQPERHRLFEYGKDGKFGLVGDANIFVESGHQNNLGPPRQFDQMPGRRQAVHGRHFDIQEHHGGLTRMASLIAVSPSPASTERMPSIVRKSTNFDRKDALSSATRTISVPAVGDWFAMVPFRDTGRLISNFVTRPANSGRACYYTQ